MRFDATMAAVISGGASGLGEATARHLAAMGVRVAILDRDAGRGANVAADIGGLFIATDVTPAQEVAAAIQTATQSLGPIRLAVACAGICRSMKTVTRERESGDIRAHDPSAFAAHIAVNLTGTFNVATLAAAHMAGLPPCDEDGERGVIVITSFHCGGRRADWSNRLCGLQGRGVGYGSADGARSGA